jgi:phage terminase large subunit
MHSTYKDNEFLDEDYKKLLESYKETDEYYYNVYCLGHWGVLGQTVFDAKRINERLQVIKPPIKRGYFEYNFDGVRITNIKWVNDPNGYINIYRLPDTISTKFCIGGDTAGDGSDYYTGHVLDVRTGEQVATFRNQFDADLYTRQMYCLGKYYSYYNASRGIKEEALIAIEANFDSYPIRELQRLGYQNQYVRESIDSYTGRKEKKFGFRTTSLTRPTIISSLIEIVREHTELLNDKDTLEELLTIIRNEKGRIEAPVGGHDDLMMGLAIAYESRSQVTLNEEPLTPYESFGITFIEPERDYGDEIVVI